MYTYCTFMYSYCYVNSVLGNLFHYVVLCILCNCVYCTTATGVDPVAVNKYIISYIKLFINICIGKATFCQLTPSLPLSSPAYRHIVAGVTCERDTEIV